MRVWPLEAGLQEQASNRLKLLSLKAMVVSAEEKVGLWAARRLNVPVKWTAERSESFMADTHGRDHVTQVELALDADGKFTGLRVSTKANLGAYLPL